MARRAGRRPACRSTDGRAVPVAGRRAPTAARPPLPDAPAGATDLLIGLGVAVAAYLLGNLVGLVSAKVLRARGRSRSFAAVFSTIFRWAATALGWSIALVIAFPSVNFASILSGLGLASLVIGIAGQSILGDLFSGIMMVVREPFKEGDQVEVGGVKGTIRLINLRETVVRTFSGTQVVIRWRVVEGRGELPDRVQGTVAAPVSWSCQLTRANTNP